MTDQHLKEASGAIKISNKLAGFLYDLMRDKITPGEIQTLLGFQNYSDKEVEYSNGWLASYALYVANQLCPQKDGAEIDE